MSADAAREAVSTIATSTLAPLVASYSSGVDAVLASQAALQARLKGLLEGARRARARARAPRRTAPHAPPFARSPLSELAAAQAAHSDAPEAEMVACAAKVEALRKRLEHVAYTMARVQVRLDSLQDAVTKFELAA